MITKQLLQLPQEERTSWMSAIKPSSTRRYTAEKGARPRDSRIVSSSEACYDEIDAIHVPPSKFQPNEAYNVLEESRRPKSPRLPNHPSPVANSPPPLPGGHPPPPTENPPPPSEHPPPIPHDRPQLRPPNRPPQLPTRPPVSQQKDGSLKPVENFPLPKEKQTVSNTYIDITEINAAAFPQNDGLYEELNEDDISAVLSSSVAPVPPPNQEERMPQPYLTPSETSDEIYEDIVCPPTEDMYEDMQNKNNVDTKPMTTAEISNIPDSPLKLEQMMKLDPNQLQMMMLIQMQMMMQKMNPQSGSEGPPKSPLERSPKPPGNPPGNYRPPPPLPTETNLYDEPPECIYDEDISTKVKDEIRKSQYVNIWDDMKPPPPPVPPKPKLKPALPPKPKLKPALPPKPKIGKLQTAKDERSTKLQKVSDERSTNTSKLQILCDEGSSAEGEKQQRSKYSFSRRRGNLQQNFTDMKMMLGT